MKKMNSYQLVIGILVLISIMSASGALSLLLILRSDKKERDLEKRTFIDTYKEMQCIIDDRDSVISSRAFKIKELENKNSEFKNSLNKVSKRDSYLKKKINNLSTDIGFNNIIGYKFIPGQKVYVVIDGVISSDTVESVFIEIFETEFEISYLVKKLNVDVFEDEIFATKEMALIKLNELKN